jgi:hypothetical protein
MSDQNQNPIDRNDPAIAPDDAPSGADHVQHNQGGASQSQGKPQGQPDTQFEQNQDSGGNTFTPDYEPEEKPNIQPSNPHKDTGRQDADIDTDGG